MHEITDDNLDEFLALPLLVVDCYTTWCPPCKKVEPIFKEIASEQYLGAVYAKVNIEENACSHSLLYWS